MHIPSITDIADYIYATDTLPRVEEDHIVISNQHYCTVIFFAHETVDHLVVHSVLRNHLPAADFAVVAQAVSWSNSKFVGLTTLLEPQDDSSLAIAFRTSMPIAAGVATQQLDTFLETSLHTTHSAVEHCMFQFPTLGRAHEDETALEQDAEYAQGIGEKITPNPYALTTWETESRQLEYLLVLDPELSQVTPRRIEAILRRYGPCDLHYQLHESHLLAKIGGLYMSFRITRDQDPEPNPQALVIEAKWIPDLHPDEHFIPIVALCSVWNQSASTTKASCTIEAEERIHINAYYSIALRYGLGEAQLMNTLRVGISNTLAAIEHISTEATGSSAVHWPL
ncbi:hypothetical protein [Corynebacterium sp.]|uniref:hypothetical protein n=1 Tax=Corynebacterium sp. TaxID=1720 RepID=UPI0026DB85FB|nr:hypothetical protein [Corynebacterium sp.]MDO5075879.1 hypothetical protein [Corynebacterium sp.]